MLELKHAWSRRKQSGIFERTQALRVFHGAGEGQGDSRFFAVDRFGDHYWVTEWEGGLTAPRSNAQLTQIVEFLKTLGAQSVVGLSRPEKGVAPEAKTFWGNPPSGRFEVHENQLKFWIQLGNTRHPGLFLDHEPLRRWLVGNVRGLKVLNAFAYTGSLSVASGYGGARHITTLDLSQPSIRWANENAKLNNIEDARCRWIAGDVFEWLPRLKREKESYDCIILDPPSFSRGNKGRFSTSKDLPALHSLAMELLTPEGLLITSINSANLNWKKYEADVLEAATAKKMRFRIQRTIDLPETFPTLLGDESSRYLKGWILQRVG